MVTSREGVSVRAASMGRGLVSFERIPASGSHAVSMRTASG